MTARDVDPSVSSQACARARACFEAGRLEEAEPLYRAALQVDANRVEALHDLGMICAQRGRIEEGLALVEKAAALQADVAEIHKHRGALLQALKHDDAAVASYKRALALDADDPETYFQLGIAQQATGRLDDAVASYAAALDMVIDVPELHYNMGTALHALNRLDEAEAQYRQAIAIDPGHVQAHVGLGHALRLLEHFDDAVVAYRQALELNAGSAEICAGLGFALERLKRNDEAVAAYKDALAHDPGQWRAHFNLANVLQALERWTDAVEHYQAALAIKPDHADMLHNLGKALYELGRLDEAIDVYQRSLAIDPRFAASWSRMGVILTELGRLDEAAIAQAKAIEIEPREPEHHFNVILHRRVTIDDEALTAAEALAEDLPSFRPEQQIMLHFALGKAYGDIGQHERSFRRLLQGNALKRQGLAYDEAMLYRLWNRVKTVFTKDLIAAKSEFGHLTTVPIFIVGMPRSGTTLVEQILASHPKVHGAGELPDIERAMIALNAESPFPECIRSITRERMRGLAAQYLNRVVPLAPTNAERITDKMPGNFRFVGLIHLMFPNARIIHTRRNPIDTCFSCFSQLFSKDNLPYTYDLAELGRHYRAYEKLMDHWRAVLPDRVMIEVDYEELVDDVESHARQIVAHCGLEWDDACLAFYATERRVQTASVVQVRQPIYRGSIGRWRVYGDLIRPLLEALDISDRGD